MFKPCRVGFENLVSHLQQCRPILTRMGSHRVCAAAVSIAGYPAIDDNLRHRRYGALSRFPSWSGVIALSSAARLIRRSRISGRALTLASAALSFSAIAFGVTAVRARPVFHHHPYGQNPSEQCPENHQRFDCFCQPQAHRPSPKPQLTPTKQRLNPAQAAAAQGEHDQHPALSPMVHALCRQAFGIV